jgi:hypothetical protein
MAKLPSERFGGIGQLTRSQDGKMRAFDIEHSNVPNAFVHFGPRDSGTRTGRAEQDRSARLLQAVAFFRNGMGIIDPKAKVRWKVGFWRGRISFGKTQLTQNGARRSDCALTKIGACSRAVPLGRTPYPVP